MHNTSYERDYIHIHERLLHYLVLGTQNLPDSVKPKQASINAFYVTAFLRCRYQREFNVRTGRIRLLHHFGCKGTDNF